ncbi:helix-turn-helix transcriptional regulator [Saccharibacillus kuerlensis]|uniref:HTH deoR-type domain-containing protein n=1 Tax=Saccharibacillus kuerlensis TaxID=459527 RepID=A0ABQ2KWV2_9BACL|nr:WYL domain-containing protein [Saccharibacillus kuerlensis]GGN95673.1 hypothetical protein GCM10010969_11790 [Saccharibacillus kuerlensis]
MRGDRLLKIVLLLQSRGRMSTRQLSEELEVTGRTVSRDMEALGQSGIPLVAHRGRFGGWSLMEGYRSGLTGMTPDETAALLLRASSGPLRDLGLDGYYEAALQKLRAVYPDSGHRGAAFMKRRLLIDDSGWHSRASGIPEALEICQEAVWENRLLRFGYANNSGDNAPIRIVQPLGLIVKRGIWYLAAQDGGTVKTFRVSKMTDVERLEHSFDYPETFDLALYWEESLRAFPSKLPHYEAKLIVEEEGLKVFRQERYVRILEIELVEDKSFVITADLAAHEFALRFVLGFGSSIRVCEPAALVEAVAAEAEKIAGIYRADCSR